MATLLVVQASGRKRDDVWSHFSYCIDTNQTEHKFMGKITTSLNRHLKVHHPQYTPSVQNIKDTCSFHDID
jgi:hypothetical protein